MSAELDLDFVNFASARINFLPVTFTLIYIWLLYNMIYHIFCKNMVHFLYTIQGKDGSHNTRADIALSFLPCC